MQEITETFRVSRPTHQPNAQQVSRALSVSERKAPAVLLADYAWEKKLKTRKAVRPAGMVYPDVYERYLFLAQISHRLRFR